MGWGLMGCLLHVDPLCPITSLWAGLGVLPLLPFSPSSFGAPCGAGAAPCGERALPAEGAAAALHRTAPHGAEPHQRPTRGGPALPVPSRGAGTWGGGEVGSFASVPPRSVTDWAAPHIASPWARGAARSCGQIGADVQGAGWEGAVFPPPSFFSPRRMLLLFLLSDLY